MFYKVDYDTAINMGMTIEPVYNDPYSHWVRVRHATWTADAGTLQVKFYLFAPQRGTLSLELISSTP